MCPTIEVLDKTVELNIGLRRNEILVELHACFVAWSVLARIIFISLKRITKLRKVLLGKTL